VLDWLQALANYVLLPDFFIYLTKFLSTQQEKNLFHIYVLSADMNTLRLLNKAGDTL